MAFYASSVLRSHLPYSLMLSIEDTTNWEPGDAQPVPSTPRQKFQIEGPSVSESSLVLLLRQGMH